MAQSLGAVLRIGRDAPPKSNLPRFPASELSGVIVSTSPAAVPDPYKITAVRTRPEPMWFLAALQG
jgi:hypothetical protein